MQKHEIQPPEVAALNRTINAAGHAYADWLTQTPAGGFVRLAGLTLFHLRPERYKARYIARAVDIFTAISSKADDDAPQVTSLLPAFMGDSPMKLTATLNQHGTRKTCSSSIVFEGQKVFTFEKTQTGNNKPSETFTLVQGPWISAFVQRFSGIEDMAGRSQILREAILSPIRYF